VHGSGAGVPAGLSQGEQQESHQRWLVDMAIRLICVLALDRFADYMSDQVRQRVVVTILYFGSFPSWHCDFITILIDPIQVVVPVRDTCAQVLAAVVRHLSDDNVECVVRLLLHLHRHAESEVRHAGLLVRDEVVMSILVDCSRG
jgi:TATA-binding protein-associated factor